MRLFMCLSTTDPDLFRSPCMLCALRRWPWIVTLLFQCGEFDAQTDLVRPVVCTPFDPAIQTTESFVNDNGFPLIRRDELPKTSASELASRYPSEHDHERPRRTGEGNVSDSHDQRTSQSPRTQFPDCSGAKSRGWLTRMGGCNWALSAWRLWCRRISLFDFEIEN